MQLFVHPVVAVVLAEVQLPDNREAHHETKRLLIYTKQHNSFSLYILSSNVTYIKLCSLFGVRCLCKYTRLFLLLCLYIPASYVAMIAQLIEQPPHIHIPARFLYGISDKGHSELYDTFIYIQRTLSNPAI